MLDFINQNSDAFGLVVATAIAGLVGYFSGQIGLQKHIHSLAERVVALETEVSKSTAPQISRLASQFEDIENELSKIERKFSLASTERTKT